MKRAISILILGLPLLVAACDSYDEVFERVDVEVPGYTPRLVVDG